jgi:hypothetical protein
MDSKEDEVLFDSFIAEHGHSPDAQELHDWALMRRPLELASKAEFEALMTAKSASPASKPLPYGSSGPFGDAMAANPGLTLEEAEEFARAFGF